MSEDTSVTETRIKELEEKVNQLDSRLAQANIRNLSLLLSLQRLIRMNKLTETIEEGAREGEKITVLLDELWQETLEDVDDGT